MEDKYLIFGTGSGTEVFLSNAEKDDFDHILGFVDNNKEKQGTLYKEKTVFAPEEVKDLDYKKIIISSLFYKEIKEKLVAQGLPEEKITTSIRDYSCSNLKQLVFLDKEKHKLKNKKFSIISPYCWSLFLYRFLDVEYHSPFVGAYIHPKYFKLLVENLDYYLGQTLKLSERDDPNIGHFCRISLDDVFFDFFHDRDPAILEEKWYRRLERFDRDNLFIHFGYSGNVNVDEVKDYTINNVENSLIITNDTSYLHQKDKKITTTNQPLDLIKWFNKEL